MSKKIDRTGEVSYTKYGTPAIIVEYKSNKEIIVEFQDEYKYRHKTSYLNFKNCKMDNPYDKTVYGIGFMGVGAYNSKDHKLAHKKWKSMMCRCINRNDNYKSSSYEKCSICEEWLNFQNFAQWFCSELYQVAHEPLCVDKDILFHDNTTYSPTTCLLVPQRINLLFIKAKSRRSYNLIGFSYDERKNKYFAQLSFKDKISGKSKTKNLGLYNTQSEAFMAYKKAKEQYIRNVADEYKDVIPKKVYDALYNYEVLITD